MGYWISASTATSTWLDLLDVGTTTTPLTLLKEKKRATLQRKREGADTLVATNAKGKDVIVKRSDVSEVERTGTKITLPENMSLDDAITALRRRKEYEDATVMVRERVRAFPWDAAWALEGVIAEKFGWSQGIKIPSFFGDHPPERRAIEIGPNGKTGYVSWGRFVIPGIDGWFQTAADLPMGESIADFMIYAETKRKYEPFVKELADAVREKLAHGGSIYQGQAIRINFTDETTEELNPLPVPKFIDVSQATPERLIFSQHIYDQIEDYLYAPILYRENLPKIGMRFRRGVLLGGPFGTGKTELAMASAHLATQRGITFIYCERAEELPHAIHLGQRFEPAIVFVEDVDRVTRGERTAEIDRILNTMDGVDTKGHEVMVVVTTNEMDTISPAMMRPGRLDVAIEVTAPDAEAAERLIRMYGKGLVRDDADLRHVSQVLAASDTKPAVIKEVVERSKLSALRRGAGDAGQVGAEDLLTASLSMKTQLELLNRPHVRVPSDVERAAMILRGGPVVEHEHGQANDRVASARELALLESAQS